MANTVRLKTKRILVAVFLILFGFALVPYFVLFVVRTPGNHGSVESDGRGAREFNFQDLVSSPGVIKPDDDQLIQLIQKEYLFYPKYYEVSSSLPRINPI